ncbi:enoyl-CoA hydratase/isomerase family protein [Natrinema soli]|uniref:Enoyl-CoA hydratase/isomerase family protein n=1 Tax=Natrinema soli TaxID=1930624 RepID=A0ABD5SLS1_9EURY|nr:enoyl-CoA hydratase/isomerase family protein [Natrinema soli]
MSDYSDISVEVTESGRANLILDRPDKLNTISKTMTVELREALAELEENDDVFVIVLQGQGGNFCAGGDVGDDDNGKPTPHARLNQSRRTTRDTFRKLENVGKPTVAAIEGYALGGGCELACCCDTRIATEEASIGVTETKLGLIPGAGGTQRLPRLIGCSRAKDMVLRGKQYSGAEMKEFGFVHELAPEDEFDELLNDVAGDYLNRSPVGIEIAKHVMNRGIESSLEAGLEMEAWGVGIVTNTEDAKEGIKAFQEDREPNFQGK